MATSSSSTPPSWGSATPIVRVGDRIPGSIMLGELADPTACRRIVGQYADSAGDSASVVGALLRAAATTVMHVVVRPLLLDGICVDAAPAALGFLLGEDLAVESIVVTAWSERPADDPSLWVAERCASLLLPVLHSLRGAAPLGPRGTAAHLADSIEIATARITRGTAIDDERSQHLIESLVREIAPRRARPLRRLEVRPDCGPTVVLPLPRVCCVGLRVAGPGACPTCPRLASDDERVRRTVAWLDGLDDDRFASIAGRRRVPPVADVSCRCDHAMDRTDT